MITYDIYNVLSGEVQFTAEINCEESVSQAFKRRLAVLWALENGADLCGADLSIVNFIGINFSNVNFRYANLRHANFSNVNLRNANLSKTDLRNANLRGANLCGANLRGAHLNGANLRKVYLRKADLSCTDLNSADLSGANFHYVYLNKADLKSVDLSDASLSGTNLSGTDLLCANLSGAHGINDWVKSLQIEEYPISYTSESMQIGCECHFISDWQKFDDTRILQMDGKRALRFWRKYKSWIFQTIELCPAKPTGTKP